MKGISVTRTLSTSMPVAKVEAVADAKSVTLHLVESRHAGRGKWINDFEVTGSPGRMAEFFEKIDDLRTD